MMDMMGLWDHGLGPWGWLALGFGLLALEAMVSGFFLLWFALGALVLAGACVVLPGSLPLELSIFAVLSVGALVIGRPVVKQRLERRDASAETLNRRADSLIGQTVVLVGDLHNGVGRARLADSEWAVRCPGVHQLSAGTALSVISVDGNILVIQQQKDVI